jgi:hypothetical protein
MISGVAVVASDVMPAVDVVGVGESDVEVEVTMVESVVNSVVVLVEPATLAEVVVDGDEVGEEAVTKGAVVEDGAALEVSGEAAAVEVVSALADVEVFSTADVEVFCTADVVRTEAVLEVFRTKDVVVFFCFFVVVASHFGVTVLNFVTVCFLR